MDKNRIESSIKWWKETDTQGIDVEKYLIYPVMEAFGDDVNEILSYLNEMKIEDLEIITGCFEEIYGKFMTDDVYDALDELEDKIKKHNNNV